MDRKPDNWISRRTLFEGGLFDVGYVVCRPTPDVRTGVEHGGLNVLRPPRRPACSRCTTARAGTSSPTPNHAGLHLVRAFVSRDVSR
jgi:hypothetical protein